MAVLHQAGDRPSGHRLRALIMILWRAGLRISEALDLLETDLDPWGAPILVRLRLTPHAARVGMEG